jgi:hypothetical protein
VGDAALVAVGLAADPPGHEQDHGAEQRDADGGQPDPALLVGAPEREPDADRHREAQQRPDGSASR